MRILAAAVLGLGILVSSQALLAEEPRSLSELLSNYRTFDGETAEVEYQEIRTLEYKGHPVFYRKMVIRLSTRIFGWLKDSKFTGWVVAGYQNVEGDGTGVELVPTATFTPITMPEDMRNIQRKLQPEPPSKQKVYVWFWRGNRSPW